MCLVQVPDETSIALSWSAKRPSPPKRDLVLQYYSSKTACMPSFGSLSSVSVRRFRLDSHRKVELLDDGVRFAVPVLSETDSRCAVKHTLEDGAKHDERQHPSFIILAAGSPGIALQVVDRLVAVCAPFMTTTEPMSPRPVQVQRSTAAGGSREQFPSSAGSVTGLLAHAFDTAGSKPSSFCWP